MMARTVRVMSGADPNAVEIGIAPPVCMVAATPKKTKQVHRSGCREAAHRRCEHGARDAPGGDAIGQPPDIAHANRHYANRPDRPITLLLTS